MLTRRHLAVVAVLAGSGAWAFGSRGSALTADDFVAIQDLYARYNWTIDAGDAEGYAATFTSDGVFLIGAKGEGGNFAGHDAIVRFANGFHAGLGGHVRHWNTNLSVAPTADGALGRVYLVLVDLATKPASILESANYSDQLVKTSQGWRFKRRVVVSDPTSPPPR